MKKFSWSLGLVLLLGSLAQADDVGYVEDFALAKDRAAALAQLIPGTEDYYYYHCLHALNTEQFAKVQQLTGLWLARFGQTQRLTEIQTALRVTDLYTKSATLPGFPEETAFATVRSTKIRARRCSESAHEPESEVHHPRRAENAILNWLRNLDNFEDAALGWLATQNLDWDAGETSCNALPDRTCPISLSSLPGTCARNIRQNSAAIPSIIN